MTERSRVGIDELRDASIADCRGAAYIGSVSTHAPDNRGVHLELPVEEPLRRARPLPPHDEMVIEDLTEDEGAAFLAPSGRELGWPRGPIVIDPDVSSADLVPGSRLAERSPRPRPRAKQWTVLIPALRTIRAR